MYVLYHIAFTCQVIKDFGNVYIESSGSIAQRTVSKKTENCSLNYVDNIIPLEYIVQYKVKWQKINFWRVSAFFVDKRVKQ